MPPATLEATAPPKTLALAGSVNLEAKSMQKEKTATCAIMAYDGEPMVVGGWGKIIIDLDGLDMPSSIPLLADHENKVSARVGSGTPSIEKNKILVAGSLTRDTTTAQEILALAKDGHNWQASVGVDVRATEYLEPGDEEEVNGQTVQAGAGGLVIIRKSLLKETSIVPIGADSDTTVTIAASGVKTALDQKVANAERIEGLEKLALDITAQHEGDSKTIKRIRDLLAEAQAGDTTLNEFELQLLRASRATTPNINTGGSSAMITQIDAQAAAAAHILCQMGKQTLAEKELGAEACEAAADTYDRRGGSILEIARGAVLASGGSIPRSAEGLLKAAWSTINIPDILSNVAGKMLLDTYQQHMPTWTGFCKKSSATDFKPKKHLRPHLKSGAGILPPGGEIKHASLGEESYTTELHTWAEMLAFTRHDLINDDLGALDESTVLLGRDLSRKLSNTIYEVVMGAQAAGHYSADNNNLLTGAGTALNADSLAAAITALRIMADEDGMPLDLLPSTLVVPPALEVQARELLTSTEVSRIVTDSSNPDVKVETLSGNALVGVAELAVEPRLQSDKFSGNSETQWFLMAGVQDAPFIVSFLDGVETPTVEVADADFNRLGVQIRAYHDWDAAPGDYRASIKSTGSA